MSPDAFEIAITDFAESIGLLVRRVRATGTSHDLSWSETAVMKRLAKDGPATTAVLARLQGMRPQSMRPIVATLEKMGLVERKPHATDGRQINLRLTPRGAAAQKAAGDAKRAWIVRAVSQLEKREQAIVFQAGRIMRRLAESEPR
ncbi:MAG TPA: MarR family transcriptional regulator [Vicinamibacterales bacterium]|jgi:DNA-binding MarR family transcriptional regulator